ncbi:MAG: hypothetical protein ACTSQZ_01975, partial [Candidatus Thorarchaeota archaeon]
QTQQGISDVDNAFNVMRDVFYQIIASADLDDKQTAIANSVNEFSLVLRTITQQILSNTGQNNIPAGSLPVPENIGKAFEEKVAGFREVVEAENIMDKMSEAFWLFRRMLENIIMEDLDANEKQVALRALVLEFGDYVVSLLPAITAAASEATVETSIAGTTAVQMAIVKAEIAQVEKAGAKMSQERLSRLKRIMDSLTVIITELDISSLDGDENTEKRKEGTDMEPEVMKALIKEVLEESGVIEKKATTDETVIQLTKTVETLMKELTALKKGDADGDTDNGGDAGDTSGEDVTLKEISDTLKSMNERLEKVEKARPAAKGSDSDGGGDNANDDDTKNSKYPSFMKALGRKDKKKEPVAAE